MRILACLIGLTAACTALGGCLVTKAAGAVVGAAGDVAEGTVNVTKGAAGAAIPDGDKDK
ncbi:MAG: hypothetical protein ABWZ40_13050 [Caulobacterales bacterium]